MIAIDDAIILQYRLFREHKYIIHCFLKDYGKLSGLLSCSKNKFPPQPGIIVKLKWQARLTDHLGSIQILGELCNYATNLFFNNRIAILMVSNCTSLIIHMIKAGWINQDLWLRTKSLLHLLTANSLDITSNLRTPNLIKAQDYLYKFQHLIYFEKFLLFELGLGSSTVNLENLEDNDNKYKVLESMLMVWHKHYKLMTNFAENHLLKLQEQRNMLAQALRNELRPYSSSDIS